MSNRHSFFDYTDPAPAVSRPFSWVDIHACFALDADGVVLREYALYLPAEIPTTYLGIYPLDPEVARYFVDTGLSAKVDTDISHAARGLIFAFEALAARALGALRGQIAAPQIFKAHLVATLDLRRTLETTGAWIRISDEEGLGVLRSYRVHNRPQAALTFDVADLAGTGGESWQTALTDFGARFDGPLGEFVVETNAQLALLRERFAR
jgi:hypothetical protein